MMRDRGCAFKVVEDGAVRYYTSDAVSGLSDFARFLHGNERDGGGSPLPLARRIPGAVEVSDAAWMAMADDSDGEGRFACFLIADIVGNVLWVNEDRGDGMGHYVFPLSSVLEMAAGAGDVWPALMARFPNARMDG